MARKLVARNKRKASTKKKQKTVRTMEYAVIPEYQERSYADKEYTTNREEKLWDPNVNVEGWFPYYNLLAQAVLTSKQEYEGIPYMEALENSCSGVAEQYISDVLHESKYEPNEALRIICVKDTPQKFIDRWKPEEMQLFTEGVMKHGKNFSIIRGELLPHKRVEDLADFYYVWKRSSMAETWRKLRTIIKDKEKEMEEKRSKERTNERLCNLLNNELLRNMSNNIIKTQGATAAASPSLQNCKEIDDDSMPSTSTSPSERNGKASNATESTDSPMEHVQKLEDELPETVTLEKSSMKNKQISDNSMKQRRKRKASIPLKIVNFEDESADETAEIKCALAPIIPQWKRQRRSAHVV